MDELSQEPAKEFLLRRAGLDRSAANEQAAARVASALGRLPLALEQAAAFVRKLSIDFDRYLEFYEESPAEILDEHAPGATQYPASVARTWLVTVGRLGPLPRALLRFVAFLAPTPIPTMGIVLVILRIVLLRRDRLEEERRALERGLRDSQKAEALGFLAASMAHDFNNVLAAMVGYAELARSQLHAEASAAQ